MAPKTVSPSAVKKVSDTKAAGQVLDAAQAVKNLLDKKKELKDAMGNLALVKKKEERKVRALKKKAGKLDLSDLMQMLVMKAYLHSKAQEESSSSSSSSSTQPWVPKNGAEAVDRLKELCETCQRPEVLAFAKTLKAGSGAAATADESLANPEA